MRKRNVSVRFVCVIVALLVVCGMFFKSEAAAGVDLSKKTIGVSFDFLEVQRRVIARDNLYKYAEEYGVKLIFQDAKGDENQQISQCENLITQGVDVLVILSHNADVMGSVVKDAKEAGIPVIAIDRLIPDANLDAYIGMNNDVIGDMIAQYAFEKKPKGNYVFIAGAPTDPNAAIYKAGYLRVLKAAIDAGDIKVVGDASCDNWSPDIAYNNVENFLTVNNDNVDVILTMNDGMAGGAVQALKSRGLDGKVLVTGQDGELAACQRIVGGTQAMSVWKPDNELSRLTIEGSVALIKGESIATNAVQNNGLKDVPCLFVDPVKVDKGNLDDTIIAAGYFTKEEVYSTTK
jgi:D-xylose transport system substrate-binding protein